MGLLDLLKNKLAIVQENKRMAGDIKTLKEVQAQLTKDILEAGGFDREGQVTYRGNEYKTYDAAVHGLNDKYEGTANWGSLQVGNIIDIRAAFIIAEGLQIIDNTRGKGKKELDFAKKFLAFNDLDQEMAQEYAKEAELEGKILIRLAWDEDAKMISARFVSWYSKRYSIMTDPQDYADYIEATWEEKDGRGKVTLKAADFVYKKFGGRVSKPNTAAPKTMKCLTQIDNLDKALRDLREINRLFASPVPVLKFEDPADAKQAQEDLDKINWKIKKVFSTSGIFSYVQPSTQGVDALIQEIINLAKLISGATGVPVHFLGLPDLLSNRATAENLMELIYASTLKERIIWTGAYKEILAKAIEIYNAQNKTTLDVSRLDVEIQFISEKNWSIIEKIFVPLALGGKISDHLLLSKIPGINVEEEEARQKENEAKNPIEDLTDEDLDGEEIDTKESPLLTRGQKQINK